MIFLTQNKCKKLPIFILVYLEDLIRYSDFKAGGFECSWKAEKLDIFKLVPVIRNQNCNVLLVVWPLKKLLCFCMFSLTLQYLKFQNQKS